MFTEKVNLIKEKVMGWLKEEACSPMEQNDPNAFFNISVKSGKIGCQIVQPVGKADSLIVVSRLALPPEMLDLLKSMKQERKTELFWDLRLSIVKNSELLDFKIESNTPEDISAVTLSSRPIFYDELTKSRLFSATYAVSRAILMVMWMLQKYAGKIPSKKDEQKLSYSS